MLSRNNNPPIGRRALMTTATKTAATLCAIVGLPKAIRAEPQTSSRPLIVASASNAVVETEAGKVRGYSRGGIYTFKGIPYAGSVSGSRRFRPPVKAEPWAGIRSSMTYGPVCPQLPRPAWEDDEDAWFFCRDDGVQGEDCLCANIWTSGINDNGKRPVMLWLHGGGFSAGSSQEL